MFEVENLKHKSYFSFMHEIAKNESKERIHMLENDAVQTALTTCRNIHTTNMKLKTWQFLVFVSRTATSYSIFTFCRKFVFRLIALSDKLRIHQLQIFNEAMKTKLEEITKSGNILHFKGHQDLYLMSLWRAVELVEHEDDITKASKICCAVKTTNYFVIHFRCVPDKRNVTKIDCTW